MKILITGAKGQLGSQLCSMIAQGEAEIAPVPERICGAQVIPVDVDDLDITRQGQVRACLEANRPDVVINCAAYTNVNRCESDFDAAMAVNALGARNLAIACEQCGAKLIHVSTDYVFSGNGDRPYTECDLPDPQSAYGVTKLLGEQYVRDFCTRYMIVRTAWLYGYKGNNFVKTMVRLAQEKPFVTVVNDQRGTPTNANDLAYHLLKLADSEEYGIYHCTGAGECTWYEFAREIARLAGVKGEIRPCTTEEYPTPAKRPAYSVLDHAMLRLTVGDEMRPWQEALACYFQHCG